jgi:hypothetical protein
MKCRTLRLSCPCGRVAKHVTGVGLSPDHQLVIYWRCARCGNQVYIAKPLAECWRECPGDDEEIQDELCSTAAVQRTI